MSKRKNRINLKNHSQENLLYLNRAMAATIIAGLLLLILAIRLFYLQVIYHDAYKTKSDNNRLNILPISPTRGLIFDRNGSLIADNIPSHRLEIIPEQVKNLTDTIERLKTIIPISEENEKSFSSLLTRKRRFEGVPIRLQLNEQEIAEFAVNRHLFPGVDIVAGLTRYYPFGENSAHVIGYVGRINEQELDSLDPKNYIATQFIGKTGVEKYYEELLHGTVGHQEVETNARGKIVRVVKIEPQKSGANLTLSLDMNLQKAAMAALNNEKGVVIAVNPKDGSLLAMASSPSYDPNLFTTGIDNKTYQLLMNSENKPLFNRALRGQYPPGSTIKPFLSLIALEKNIISPEKRIFDPGWFSLPGDSHKYRDWRHSGHGWITLKEAITQSCSTYFYYLANKLGIDNIHSVLTDFGFGNKTKIDISSEEQGLVPSAAWKKTKLKKPWYPGETLIAGIGQGYTLTTPIQLANATTILANKGKKLPLHIVKEINNIKIENILANTQQEYIKEQDPKAWQFVHAAMLDVTQKPTGTAFRYFRNAQYSVAAKTGTAQVSNIKQGSHYNEQELAERLRDHSLFIGYAPAENPKIVIMVILENKKGSALIARKVLDSFFEGNSLEK